jgi:hypothetical protein
VLRTAFHPDGKLGGYGSYFNREWCTVVDEVAADLDVVRYWDLAAIPIGRFGIKLGRDRNGGYWLLDLARGPADPGDVDRLLLNTATQDGKQVRIGLARIRDRPARARRCTGRARSGFTATPASRLSRPPARPLYRQPPICDRRCHALQPLLGAARIFDGGFCDALPRFSSVRVALFREYPSSPPFRFGSRPLSSPF